MKKSLILSVCITMLFTVQGSVKQTEAINFEGQEDKYMSLCSSSRLSNSNYSTCKQFNT